MDRHRRTEKTKVAKKPEKNLVKIELPSPGHDALKAHDQEPEQQTNRNQLLEVACTADHCQRIQNLRQKCGVAD